MIFVYPVFHRLILFMIPVLGRSGAVPADLLVSVFCSLGFSLTVILLPWLGTLVTLTTRDLKNCRNALIIFTVVLTSYVAVNYPSLYSKDTPKRVFLQHVVASNPPSGHIFVSGIDPIPVKDIGLQQMPGMRDASDFKWGFRNMTALEGILPLPQASSGVWAPNVQVHDLPQPSLEADMDALGRFHFRVRCPGAVWIQIAVNRTVEANSITNQSCGTSGTLRWKHLQRYDSIGWSFWMQFDQTEGAGISLDVSCTAFEESDALQTLLELIPDWTSPVACVTSVGSFNLSESADGLLAEV